MAMKKLLVTNNVEAEYWRIVGYTVSISGKMCQIFLSGYASGKTRANNAFLSSRNYMILQDKFDLYIGLANGVHVAGLYDYLKSEVADFDGAEDILEEFSNRG